MGREQVRRLPIVDNGKLLAMVSLWCESLSGHLSRPSGVRWPLLEQIDESRRGLGKVLDSLGWGPIETPSRVEKIDRILETMNRAPSAGDLQAYYAYSLIARRKAFGDSTAVRLHTESGAQLHRTLPSAYRQRVTSSKLSVWHQACARLDRVLKPYFGPTSSPRS